MADIVTNLNESEVNVCITDSDDIEVFFQEAAILEIDVALKYIKSGIGEIQKYVDEVSKPELKAYVAQKEQEFTDLSDAARSYADEAKTYAEQAQQAETNAKVSEDKAGGYAKSASDSFDMTVKSKDEAKEYAEQARQSNEDTKEIAAAVETIKKSIDVSAENVANSEANALDSAGEARKWAEYAQSIAGTAFHYKGMKPSYSDLPQTDNEIGDVWKVNDTEAYYTWTGIMWDKLGETVDISGKADKEDVEALETRVDTIDATFAGLDTEFAQKENISNKVTEIGDGSDTQYPSTNAVKKYVDEKDGKLNNPFFLGQSMYSPTAPNNLSWLKSEGQWNSGDVYKGMYEHILENVKKGTKDFVSITDSYDDYCFVIDELNNTFRLPLLDGSEGVISDKNENWNLGTSGSSYIAPANGWLYLSKVSGIANGWISIKNNTASVVNNKLSSTTNSALDINLPCKRGDNLIITYSATGTVGNFKFIYATGNGSLYYYVGETAQNLNLIDVAKIMEQLPDKADISTVNSQLANKADINSTVIDGQWVSSYVVVGEEMTPPTSGTIDHSLSNYLPKDGYNYEVFVSGYCYTGTTSGNSAILRLQSDIISGSMSLARVVTWSAKSAQAAGCSIIPIGTSRVLKAAGHSSNTGKYAIYLHGYRRIGTNK